MLSFFHQCDCKRIQLLTIKIYYNCPVYPFDFLNIFFLEILLLKLGQCENGTRRRCNGNEWKQCMPNVFLRMWGFSVWTPKSLLKSSVYKWAGIIFKTMTTFSFCTQLIKHLYWKVISLLCYFIPHFFVLFDMWKIFSLQEYINVLWAFILKIWLDQ